MRLPPPMAVVPAQSLRSRCVVDHSTNYFAMISPSSLSCQTIARSYGAYLHDVCAMHARCFVCLCHADGDWQTDGSSRRQLTLQRSSGLTALQMLPVLAIDACTARDRCCLPAPTTACDKRQIRGQCAARCATFEYIINRRICRANHFA